MADVSVLEVRITGTGIGRTSSDLSRLDGNVRRSQKASDALTASLKKTAIAVLAVYSAYKLLEPVIKIGMRVETLGVAMGVVAKNAGISTQALKYFTQEVRSAGITTAETYSAITKAMVLGLDLNLLKDLATRARDIAVVAGLDTSETLARLMHGIESQSIEIFRNIGVSVRNTEDYLNEYAQSLGKTRKELTQVERAQATLNEAMRASAGAAGAAAAADKTVGKQLASMTRVAKQAYESLWKLFEPGMLAAVRGLSQGFKELDVWARANEQTLYDLGLAVGEAVSGIITAAINTTKWAAENATLLRSLAELLITYKLIKAALNAIIALQGAFVVSSVAATQAVSFLTAAEHSVTMTADGFVRRGITPMTAAVEGLTLSVLGAVKAFTLLAAAWAFGAYKFQKSMREEPEAWEFVPGLDVPVYRPKAAKRRQAARGVGPHGEAAESGFGPLTAQQQKEIRDAERDRAYAEAAAAMKKRLAQEGVLDGKGGGGGGGGGATDRSTEQMLNLIQNLQQELARLSEDSIKQIDIWYQETVSDINKLIAQGQDGSQALSMAHEAASIKKQKVEEDFHQRVASLNNDQLAQLEGQYQEDLRKFASTEANKQELHDAYAKKRRETELSIQNDILGAYQQQFSAISSASFYISDQLEYRQLALDVEKQIAEIQLKQFSLLPYVTEEMKKQLELLLQQADALKQQQLERDKRKTQGAMGAFEQYGEDASKRAETAQYDMVYQMLNELPQIIGGGIARNLIATAKGHKADWEEIGWTIAESLLDKMLSGFIDQLTGVLADSLSGLGSSLGKGIGGMLGNLFGFGHGAVFYRGMVKAYQHGEVFHSPTAFAMRGGMGVLGEKGPEAVMPLKRTSSGHLGVMAEGATPVAVEVPVHIHNETGVPMTAETRFDGKQIEVHLAKIVTQNIARGGEIDRALRGRYGLKTSPQRR